MIQALIRMVLFALGVAMCVEVFMPLRAESLTVDSRYIEHSNDHSSRSGRGSYWRRSTYYKLRFAGGHTHECSVGASAYNTFADGVAVDLRTTRIFGECIQIASAETKKDINPLWKLWNLIFGCALIAAAFGVWRDTSQDDDW